MLSGKCSWLVVRKPVRTAHTRGRRTFDRVLATCSVQAVPYAWVAQTRPGGIILTPWGSTFENSALLRLTVDNDGQRAVGVHAADP